MSKSKASHAATALETFQYNPLDPTIDGIRLVVLKPSVDSEAVLRCDLQHVTFSQRPKYEALSYCWGSQANEKKEILLDEKCFQVGYSLWEALVHLRNPEKECFLWIDAICINQADVTERNQQIRIMPHIYGRAQSVVAWLGVSRHGGPIKERDMILDLCDREYWNRVWIVQEIGRARKIRIHFVGGSIDWSYFTDELFDLRNDEIVRNSVPQKLANQLEDKYGEGHKLHSLLKSYQNSMCTEPRDKIYGFVGLATDCDLKFPIDYEKRLFDVWKDSVLYKSNDKISPPFDILQFAQLLKTLLGGHEIASRDDLPNHDGVPFYLTNKQPSLVRIPVLVSGWVVHLGPTYWESFSSIQKVDRWKSSIKGYSSMNSLPIMLENNDCFLELLEELQGTDLRIISQWNPAIAYYLNWEGVSYLKFPYADKAFYSDFMRRRYYHVKGLSAAESTSAEAQLFLLKNIEYNPQPKTGAASIGLAPPGTRVGDLICHIYESETAVVLRQEEGLFSLIGTSVLAKDLTKARIDRMSSQKANRVERASNFAIPFNSEALSCGTDKLPIIDLYLDIPSVFNWSY